MKCDLCNEEVDEVFNEPYYTDDDFYCRDCINNLQDRRD
jgi:hypothetical protein